MQSTNCNGEGGESLQCHPGSELRLGGTKKWRVKIISCCGCDVANSTKFVVLHLNTSFSACVRYPFVRNPSVGRWKIACRDLVLRTDHTKKSQQKCPSSISTLRTWHTICFSYYFCVHNIIRYTVRDRCKDFYIWPEWHSSARRGEFHTIFTTKRLHSSFSSNISASNY